MKKLIILFLGLIFILIGYHLFKSDCVNGECEKNISSRSIYLSKNLYSCIAVLVEFRITNRIITIVQNVNDHIPSTWSIQIFHGKDNEDLIKNSTLAPLIASGKLFLTFMEQVYDRARTNQLFTDPKF
ncbi:unnamed protein product [Rotaria sordida]|uniref:Uncharacterized protein n=1 Tax=Rotaria sordida TaxID=392033 RepID=A0A815V002_9BILA|nr:unnamed protein product [Rotaria sordida]CAF3774583.1 unnamed protein product [Rotaria sordida]